MPSSKPNQPYKPSAKAIYAQELLKQLTPEKRAQAIQIAEKIAQKIKPKG